MATVELRTICNTRRSPFFDTLGKLHFPSRVSSGRQPHLAQVEANRIAGSAVVGLFLLSGRRGLRVRFFLRLYLNGGRMVGNLGGEPSIYDSDVLATSVDSQLSIGSAEWTLSAMLSVTSS